MKKKAHLIRSLIQVCVYICSFNYQFDVSENKRSKHLLKPMQEKITYLENNSIVFMYSFTFEYNLLILYELCHVGRVV